MDGKLNGQGKFFIKNGTFSLESNYSMGEAEFEAHKYLFKVISPVEEDEDPKAGKKDAKKAVTPIEEEAGGNDIKL